MKCAEELSLGLGLATWPPWQVEILGTQLCSSKKYMVLSMAVCATMADLSSCLWNLKYFPPGSLQKKFASWLSSKSCAPLLGNMFGVNLSKSTWAEMGFVLPKVPQSTLLPWEGWGCMVLVWQRYCGMCEADGSGVGLLWVWLAGSLLGFLISGGAGTVQTLSRSSAS